MTTPPKITRITATPTIPIENRNETVSLQRNVTADIWNSSSPTDTNDGVTGSLKPVGFKLRKPIVMKIMGEATYPEYWPKVSDGDCIIIGSIIHGDSSRTDVLKGSWRELKLTEPVPRPAPLPDVPFEVDLALIEPQGTDEKIVPVPWGFFGDVEWRIETQFTPTQTLIVPVKTRLEIYQLATMALGGPTEALFAESTLPNFQGKWPVLLLRLLMPGPSDLKGKSKEIQENVILWWASFVCTRVASFGVQYDAVEGRSGYGVGVLGGSFDLSFFYDMINLELNPLFSNLALGLNSFDLTSLVEAAFTIFLPSVDAEDHPRPKASWITLTPCGAIADKNICSMVPLGWQHDAAAAQGVLTPFFKGTLEAKPEDGILAATAWLEIDLNPGADDPVPALVVQMAFNTKGKKDSQPRPDVADVARTKFLSRHFQDTDIDNQKNWFFDSSSIPSVNNADTEGNDLARRAGLYNLRGVNEPWPWRYPASGGKPSILALPPSLQTAIGSALLLSDKKNNAATAKRHNLVNAGSLRPSRVYALLKPKVIDPVTNTPQPDRYNGRLDYFRLVVGRGVSVATYIAPLDAPVKLKDAKARVKISTFEKFSDALDGLISSLSGFESDISKVVVSNDADAIYGHYMVRTTQSLMFVRNNLLVDMIILDLGSYKLPEAEAALLALANSLDKDFILNSAPRGQSRKATFEITDPAPPFLQNATKVFIDKPFVMTISNVDLLAEEIGVFAYSDQSGVRQPIIFTSARPMVADPAVGTSTRSLGFLPVQNDADSAQDVEIAVTGVHYDTFYPVTKTTRVELQK